MYTLKVLTNAKADCVFTHKDAFAFGNLPCRAGRAIARNANMREQ